MAFSVTPSCNLSVSQLGAVHPTQRETLRPGKVALAGDPSKLVRGTNYARLSSNHAGLSKRTPFLDQDSQQKRGSPKPMDARRRTSRGGVTAAVSTAPQSVPFSPPEDDTPKVVPLTPAAETPVTRFFQAGFTSVSAKFSVFAYLAVKWSAGIQLFLLKHRNFVTRFLMGFFYVYEAAISNLDKDPEQSTLVNRKLKYLGPNFPVYGGVMVGDINVVRKLILSPQKRGPYVAWGLQVAKAYPDNMLLFLDDKAAGGSGEREQIKDLLVGLFTSEAVMNRGKDEVAQSLVSSFAKEMKGGNSDGLAFTTTYILYVVFGIGPDPAATELVTKGVKSYIGARVWPLGLFKRGLSADEKKVRALLASSPLVAGADLNGYDREKFIDALMPVLHVAAIPGPATFIWYATSLLPSSFKWNYGSEEANLNAVYEALRAHPPVASVASYLQAPADIDVHGELHRFPAGTKVMYSIKTGTKDPAIHSDALKVDVTRPNLAQHILNFASFGPENFGRQCPGRKVAERLGVDLFRNLGDLGFQTSNP